MKIPIALAILALVGCVTEPKDKIIDVDCTSQADSSTWTDTTQIDYFACHESKESR